MIEDYKFSLIKITEPGKIQDLADQYVKKGIIPIKKIADAYHIALSVINDIDFLVSWNYKHMANVKKRAKYRK